MRRIIAIIFTASMLSFTSAAQPSLSLTTQIDVGSEVSDVVISPDGQKWLISTATELLLWDNQQKRVKWQKQVEQWAFPRRAAMNQQYVYLIGPDRTNLRKLDVHTGQELKEIAVTDKMGSTTAIAINRLPGEEHAFLLSAGPYQLYPNAKGHHMATGSFIEGEDVFVNKPVKGKGGGLLRFAANGKYLKEGAKDHVLYSFDKSRDFDQEETQLMKRWRPAKGTTFGYLPSGNGKFVYHAYFWRSVNSKKEYLIEKKYMLTGKVMNSLIVEDEPQLFSLAGEGDQLLITTRGQHETDHYWSVLDISTWTIEDLNIPIKTPKSIFYDEISDRNFIADDLGNLWILENKGNSASIITYQLDGARKEASIGQMVSAQALDKDESATARVKNDPKSALDEPQYYIDMAFVLSNQYKFQAAYEAFRKVYQAYPEDQFTNAFMGWFTLLTGTLDGVEPLMKKATELIPFDPIAHQLYGYFHLLNGDHSMAEEEIKKTISYKVDNEGMGVKNTDWALINAAGYPQDFSEFDQWMEGLINQDLQKRATNLRRFQTAQKQSSPRNKYNQMIEVIQQEKLLKVPRAAILGAAMSEASASGRKIGEVQEAMQLGKSSVELLLPYGDIALLVGANTNAGHAYNQGFKFDLAKPYYEEALKLIDEYEGDGIEVYRVPVLNGLGGVYDNQGEDSRALTYYEKALEISRADGNKVDEAIAMSNIATVYIAQGSNVTQALRMLEQGMDIYKRAGDQVVLANNFNNMAYGLMLMNKPFQAIEYFKKAELLYAQLGMTSNLAQVNNAIGKLLISYNRKTDAIAYYHRALKYINESADPEMAKTVYANLAGGLLGQEQYQEAAVYAEKAIRINEILLKDASPKATRGLRSATNNYYRIVSLAKHRQKDYSGAFEAHERNRSRVMLGKMGAGPTIETRQLQGMLRADQVLIDYNVVHLYWEVHSHLFATVISSNQIGGKEYADSTLISSLKQEGEERFVSFMNQRSMLQQIRQYVSEKGVPENVAQSLVRDSNLEKTIEFYRHLIKEPNARNELLRKSYARVFYDLLIQPLVNQLDGKKELIIIPDGPLAFLPFETLLDANGKYLAETYKIRYTQSATVLRELSNRTYAASRKPLLAFGGPVFEELDAGGMDNPSDGRGLTFNQLQASYYAAEESGASMRPTYIQMGFTKMTPLPGTIYETNQIKSIVSGAELYQKDDASENRLKTMAKANELANFKVLHFATHGWAYAEIPELSAIVLGQYRKVRGQEDGFLRVPEIEQLNLKADFVNLSACETALGKLYSSEGVVGLTQAFLVAGAKSISVTQWTVSDEGTAIFMTEMYRKVFQQKQSYLDAFTATKTEFIQGKYGEKFRHPDYWGPFVYYGI